jgi:hypothetical protein
VYACAFGNPLLNWADQLGLKPGDKFPVINRNVAAAIQAAAIDALDWVYKTYPHANLQFAGTVFRDSNGDYIATNPKFGRCNRVPTPQYIFRLVRVPNEKRRFNGNDDRIDWLCI